MNSKTLAALILLTLFSSRVQAIILFGLDNSQNRTDPGTGAPWESVGRLSNSAVTVFGGSGVYLGNGYVLTANHVGPFASITFDGTTFYTHDGIAPVQVAANVDMKILRLTTMPTVAAVSLLSTQTETVSSATLVGWGVGRDPATTVNTNVVPWDLTQASSAKRWGLNTPRALANVGHQSGSYEALVTYLGATTGSPAGLGNSEAAATLLDSGSGLFQKIGSIWYLIGLTTGVETANISTFGNDQVSDSNGDANFFARISTYASAINTQIPEPSAFLLISPALLLLLRRRR